MKPKMKLTLLFVLAFMTWSCNERPKNESDNDNRVVKTEKEIKKEAENNLLDQLRNTKQVDLKNLENWIPKSFGGLSLERTKSYSLYGEAQMTGSYKREGDKMIILAITDAAGPNRDMITNKINVLGSEPDSDVDGLQMRSVNVKGRMARQDYNTEKNVTNILFFHKKRFMIKITAYDNNVEDTWHLVDELDFHALDDFIR